MGSKVIGKRWRIVDNIGEGGQAHTFRVQDLHDGSTHWILKRLKNPKRLARFEREIRALDALNSPHIPKTEDYSIEEPAFHVTEDLGVALDKYVLANPLTIDRALDIFEQVVSAVRDAHETARVVHRDIKPNNVVVSPDGIKAYLIDFGICQYSDGELTLLTTEEAFGNPAFAAPETFLGREEEPGTPCDVYSLGKLLYWMVSGGKHISREYISDGVLERIRTHHRLVRFYVARLLRGTVVEAPASRWTAQRLLKEVVRTRGLVARVKDYEEGGLAVLADGFDLDDSYDGPWRRARKGTPAYPPWVRVISSGTDEQPYEVEVGVAFEGPDGRDARLEGIDLALEHRAGEDEALIRIVPDRDGKPDEGEVLESFGVSGEGNFSVRVERLRSRAKPVLREGGRYWILLSVPRDGSEAALRLAPTDFAPQEIGFAERFDGGEWGEVKSASSPGYAVRVTGRRLPEAEE